MLLLYAWWLVTAQTPPQTVAPQACAPRSHKLVAGGPYDPAPGIALWLGIATGMTRAEVAAVDPKLARSQDIFGLEPVPGLRGRGRPYFDSRTHLVSSFSIRPVGARSKAIAQLTGFYGAPLQDESKSYLAEISGGRREIREKTSSYLCWSDRTGTAEIRLVGNDEYYEVTASAPRPR